jgi:hypothetical protein
LKNANARGVALHASISGTDISGNRRMIRYRPDVVEALLQKHTNTSEYPVSVANRTIFGAALSHTSSHGRAIG